MSADIRAQQAREHHREAQKLLNAAARRRAQRDSLIRKLRSEDPAFYTHVRLAKIVGCSPELIAHVLRNTQVG